MQNTLGWRDELMNAIADRSTKFTVVLDGLDGSTVRQQVDIAVQRGSAPFGRGQSSPTNWEIFQLAQGGRLPDVTFMFDGKVVANPWAQ